MVPSRFVVTPEMRRQFGPQLDRIAPFLLRSDPLADAADAALVEVPGGFALVEEALRGGPRPAALPQAVRELLDHVEAIPAWADDEVLERAGQILFRAGPVAGMVLGMSSLIEGYASPAGNKPLMFSGRLTEKQAPRRLSETARFVEAVCAPGGVLRFGDGMRITVKVRLMHASVRRMILASGRWDSARWGHPINQYDMMGTQLLFSTVFVRGLTDLGILLTTDEVAAYMHLWRYVGHLIGVDPAISPAGERDADRFADLIRMAEGTPDEDSRRLTNAVLNSAIASAKNDRELRTAQRRQPFVRAIARHLIRDPRARALGLSPSAWDALIPVFRRIVRASERARLRSSLLDKRAHERGEAYWRFIIKSGLGNVPFDFRPAKKLDGIPVEAPV